MKSFKSLSTFLKQQILLSLTVGIVALTGTVIYRQYNAYHKGLAERSKITLNVTSKALSEPLWNFNEDAIAEFSNSVLQDPDVYYYEVLDAKGASLYKSTSDKKDVSFETLCGQKAYLCDSTSVDREGGSIGKIRVAFSLARIENEIIQTLTLLLVLGVTVIVGLAVLMSAIVTRLVKKPLADLGSGAHELAEGNLNYDFHIEAKNEIGLLAQNFIAMRDSIKAKIVDLMTLNDLSQQINGLNTAQDVMKLVASIAGQRLRSHTISCYRSNGSGRDYEWLLGNAEKHMKSIGGEQLSFRSNRIQISETKVISGRPATYALLPLVNESGESFGLIAAEIDLRDEPQGSERSFLETLTRTAATRLENLAMIHTIEEQNRNLERTVEERTRQLARKTEDLNSMLKNVKLGIFTLMDERLVHPEYSRYLEDILGTNEIAGRDAMRVVFMNSNLGDDMKDQMRTAIDVILGEESWNYDANGQLLVRRIKLQDARGKEKDIELEWNPIVNEDGIIERLLVTARDVTELNQLRAKAAQKSEEMEIVQQLLLTGPSKFDAFRRFADKALAEADQLLAATNKRSDDVINRLFRSLHTIKGNARILGYSHLTDSVHIAENRYATMRSHPELPWNQLELLQEVRDLKNELNTYKLVYEQYLAKLSRDSDRETLQDMIPEISATLKSAGPSKEISVLRKLYDKLMDSRSGKVPLNSAFEDIKSSLPALASKLGKEQPRLDLQLPNSLVEMDDIMELKNAFIHLVTNAMDHGIENPDVRKAKGKDSKGRITVRAQDLESGLRFEVFDDGAGLNFQALRKKLTEAGRPVERMSDQEIAATIFEANVSTAAKVTDLSGRGVGLDAVREIFQNRGGGIDIVIEGQEEQEGRRSIRFIIDFPKRAMAKSA